MYVRYVQGARGLCAGGYDFDRPFGPLRRADHDALRDWLNAVQPPPPPPGLFARHPGCKFAFTEQGAARYTEWVALMAACAINPVSATVIDPAAVTVVWTDGDQVAYLENA